MHDDSDVAAGMLDMDDILGVLHEAQAIHNEVEAPDLATAKEPELAASSAPRPGLRRGLRPGIRIGLRPGKVKKLTKKQLGLDRQARAFNSSGRSRNEDFHFPLQETGLERPQFQGRGAWKTWSPIAILRAGFSDEKATNSQVASCIEGAGKTQAAQSRLVVAQAIMTGQKQGMKGLQARLKADMEGQGPAKMVYAIRNLMFDESSFDLSMANNIASSHSVLCSHAQFTYRFEGDDEVHDEHILRPPAILSPVMNSATMHAALSSGNGGLSEVLDGNIKYVATLTTSDAHAANIRMLRFIDQELEERHLFLPSLCLQHRVGNIIEQLTKFLGNLGGNFSVAKVMSKGNLLQALQKQASGFIAEKLLILPETPPALMEEWSQAQLQAQDLIKMCMSYDYDDADPLRSGTHREAFQHLVNFFGGPWTGLNLLICCLRASKD